MLCFGGAPHIFQMKYSVNMSGKAELLESSPDEEAGVSAGKAHRAGGGGDNQPPAHSVICPPAKGVVCTPPQQDTYYLAILSKYY